MNIAIFILAPESEFTKLKLRIRAIEEMNINRFNLNLLKVLDALLREGSSTGAARRLGLSQPAVSSALARLRAALGDPLFVRRGNRLQPTEAALSLAAPVRRIIGEAETLLEGPGAFEPARARGLVRLAGTDFFAETLVPSLTRRLRAEAPGIQLQFLNLAPEDHLAMLQRQDVDIALLPVRGLPAWADAVPLFSAEFVVITALDHPSLGALAPGDDTALPLEMFCALPHAIMSPQGRLRTATDDALAERGLARTVALSMPSFTAIFSIVAASDLIAVVPGQLARLEAARRGLRLFLPPLDIPAPLLHAVWHRHGAASPLKRYLRDLAVELLAPGGAGQNSR